MKVARPSTARVSTRPEYQIQFDEGADDCHGQEKTADRKKRYSGFAVYWVFLVSFYINCGFISLLI
jgi:hypothetical protein